MLLLFFPIVLSFAFESDELLLDIDCSNYTLNECYRMNYCYICDNSCVTLPIAQKMGCIIDDHIQKYIVISMICISFIVLVIALVGSVIIYNKRNRTNMAILNI